MLTLRFLYKMTISILYSLIYFRSLKINPINAYFHGRLSIINGEVSIGNNFRNKFDLNISVNGGKLSISNRVFCNNNVSINCRKKIIIGSDVLFGENVTIYDHDHRYRHIGVNVREQGFDLSEVIIGDNVWIGSNCIILKGVNIGSGSVIGAGSIINKDVPKNTLVLQKRNSEYRDIIR